MTPVAGASGVKSAALDRGGMVKGSGEMCPWGVWWPDLRRRVARQLHRAISVQGIPSAFRLTTIALSLIHI